MLLLVLVLVLALVVVLTLGVAIAIDSDVIAICFGDDNVDENHIDIENDTVVIMTMRRVQPGSS